MNILILGDVMLDIQHQTVVKRKCPENPNVPVHFVEETKYLLGGAANVASNLAQVNANVYLLSSVGDDVAGQKIKELLKKWNIHFYFLQEGKRKTTQKTRIFEEDKLIARFDIEDTAYINERSVDFVLQSVCSSEIKYDAILFSDYDKGFLEPRLCKEIIKYANLKGIPTFVDPKVRDVEKFSQCFCFKPNFVEASTITANTRIQSIFLSLFEQLECKNIVLTHGSNGIYCNSEENHSFTFLERSLVKDVTGAGDIVLAILVFVYIVTDSLQVAAEVANKMATISVQYLGNYVIEKELVGKQLFLSLLHKNGNKLVSNHDLPLLRESLKDQTIVFTNGCFDILHSAHLQNLKFARSQGDVLIVGLNSNSSVKKLKGPERPINGEDERSLTLSLLESVDYIVIFEEPTPYEIIQALKPDILVKGSDYQGKAVIGADLVREVRFFPYVPNHSSSLVIEKVKKL
jgi:D-beta-D-heptose 7-phosphate kinase/D-beta-D-heptose 1-phosphate adenosyltransferase